MSNAPRPAGAHAPCATTGRLPVPRGHLSADISCRRRVPFPFKKHAEGPHHSRSSPAATSSPNEQLVTEEPQRVPLVRPVRTAPLPIVTKGCKDSKKAAHIEKRKRYLETCALVDSFEEMSVTCKACQRDVALGAPYLLRAWRKHLREDTRCMEKRVAMVECGKLSLSVLELKHPWAPQRVK